MGIFSRAAHINTDEKKVDALLARGVSEVIVKEDLRRKLLSGKQLRVKLGIDPTSPDLHIGRAIPLLKLRDFQELGHKVVLIVGDFTAVIGDTSDKDAERPMLSTNIIEKNKKTYFAQAGKLLDLSKIEMRYNSEWLGSLTYKEIGEHADLFSVSDFIARENISKRLEAGKRVSLRELLYPLMQGYDSVAIKADVELGGTDQKFNVLAGRPMQEHFGQPPQSLLLNPLIDGLDGTKMSSSRGNVITLTVHASDMYGKVMSMADVQVQTYFELCTRVPISEVTEILTGHPKEAKMRLAREIVTLYHGGHAAQKAETDFITLFSKGEAPANVLELKKAPGEPLMQAFVAAGDVKSNSEFRQLLASGAVTSITTGERVTDPNYTGKDGEVIRIGKHRVKKIIFN